MAQASRLSIWGDQQTTAMGAIRKQRPVLLLVAAFSRYPEALDWVRQRAIETWGPLALESDRFDFDFTTFYERDMGQSLKKGFLAFERLIDAAELPRIKVLTNAWEEEYAGQCEGPENRPLNLDPGYLTEAKLVLASTKDRDHRIYLSDGIFAEGTLYFYKGQWADRPWTYPDYKSQPYQAFLSRCRNYLRHRYESLLE